MTREEYDIRKDLNAILKRNPEWIMKCDVMRNHMVLIGRGFAFEGDSCSEILNKIIYALRYDTRLSMEDKLVLTKLAFDFNEVLFTNPLTRYRNYSHTTQDESINLSPHDLRAIDDFLEEFNIKKG